MLPIARSEATTVRLSAPAGLHARQGVAHLSMQTGSRRVWWLSPQDGHQSMQRCVTKAVVPPCTGVHTSGPSVKLPLEAWRWLGQAVVHQGCASQVIGRHLHCLYCLHCPWASPGHNLTLSSNLNPACPQVVLSGKVLDDVVEIQFRQSMMNMGGAHSGSTSGMIRVRWS